MAGDPDLRAWETFLGHPVVGVVLGVFAAGVIAFVWWRFYRPVRKKKEDGSE